MKPIIGTRRPLTAARTSARLGRPSPLGNGLLAIAVVVGGCQAATVTPVASPGTSRTPSAPASVAANRTAAPSLASATPTPSAVEVPLLGELSDGAFDAARVAALQHVLDTAVHDGAPDVIAAVITADGTWSGAAGVGGPDGRKATPHDEFAIASVSTTLIAALVMRLAEQGKIDLDAPIAGYLGGRAFDTNGATVRQALGQRTGIPDIGPEVGAAIAADPARHWSLDDTLAVLPDRTGKPGPWSPALSNYVMAVLAIEHVTGGPLSAALRAELLDPFGADRILEQGAGVPTPKPWALPTAEHLGRFKVGDLGAGGAISCIASATASYGAGSLASDASSLAVWTWRLFAGDIVDRVTLAAMVPGSDGHGLGIDVLDAPLDRAIGSTGGKTGYGTVLAVIPAQQIVAVVFVNDENFRIDSYIADLLKAAQGA